MFVRNVESHVQFIGQSAPWEVNKGARIDSQALQFQTAGVCRQLPGGAGIGHY